MARPIVVPMSPGITVADNYVIRFTAIDPTTGATVNGVRVSSAAVLGNETQNSGAAGGGGDSGPVPNPLLIYDETVEVG